MVFPLSTCNISTDTDGDEDESRRRVQRGEVEPLGDGPPSAAARALPANSEPAKNETVSCNRQGTLLSPIYSEECIDTHAPRS